MKTAKTSKGFFLLYNPISRKAYLDFMARIYYVFPFGSSEAEEMVEELDYYIKFKRESGKLSEKLKYAFKFLKMDIDLALARSSSARRRAYLRRNGNVTTKVESKTMPWRKPSDEGYRFDGKSSMILNVGNGYASHPVYAMDAALIRIRKSYRRLREMG